MKDKMTELKMSSLSNTLVFANSYHDAMGFLKRNNLLTSEAVRNSRYIYMNRYENILGVINPSVIWVDNFSLSDVELKFGAYGLERIFEQFHRWGDRLNWIDTIDGTMPKGAFNL